MGASGTTPLGWSGDSADAYPIGTNGGEARVNVGFELRDGALSRDLTVVQARMHAERILAACDIAAAHNAGLSR